LTAGLVFYQANKGGVQTPDAGAPAGINPAGNVVLSMQEIAKHNSASDCWMIFLGKVYDVTSALSSHPASPAAITPYCGKDGTEAFKTKDKPTPKDHSAQAHGWLDGLYIGDIGQVVTPAVIQKVKVDATKIAAPKEDDEYEDD